ncbi:hypothetical protein Vretimale_19418, partial [Volvox reticuliferus]
LLVTDGAAASPGIDLQLPPQGPHVPLASGLWPGEDTSMDGLEDDIPARRTGRPPRYDPGNRAAFAAGHVGSVVGGGLIPDTSLLHPPPPQRPDHDPRRVMLQGPSDPRVGGARRSSAPGPDKNQQGHQQQQYVQFPCRVKGAATTAGSGDSQDPEGLPGMRYVMMYTLPCVRVYDRAECGRVPHLVLQQPSRTLRPGLFARDLGRQGRMGKMMS